MKPKYLQNYPHIFTPLTICSGTSELTFTNRLMVAPLEAPVGVDFQGRLLDCGIDFYASFVKGGFSAFSVTQEIPHNSGHPRGLVLDDEETTAFADAHKLQRLIHSYNAVSMIELTHPGFCALPKPGIVIKSASDGTWNGQPVKAMNYKDMEELAELFARAAMAAKRAGFDMIQLNGSNGWLISQFLSPLTNHRTDEFGGSVENRCRFPKMLVQYIKEYTGMPIELRMSGRDGLELSEGIQPKDAAQQALVFEEAGVDMLHFSTGNRLNPSTRPQMTPSDFLPSAINLPAAIESKKAGVKIPVGIVGKVHDPALIENLLAEGAIDYVFMTRQAIADPEFPNKIKEGRTEDIRPCLHCNYCSDGGRRGSSTKNITFNNTSTYNVECSVNPLYGQGVYKLHIPDPKTEKRVAIIGGGVAGMVAAITASRRGHQVTLYEKTKQLGGLLSFSDHLWFKESIKKYRDYLITQLVKTRVDVHLNTEATPELMDLINPDAIIVAIGGRATIPPIEGISSNKVLLAMDAIENQEKIGQDVVIIGGGSVGCELAIQIADEKRSITVVEMANELMQEAHLSERVVTLQWLKKKNINEFTNTKCRVITDTGVEVEKDGEKAVLKADTVILCAGYTPLIEERNAFWGHAYDVIYVGDCKQAANIRVAVDAAYSAAMIL